MSGCTLRVTIIAARDLKKTEISGADPFFTFTVAAGKEHASAPPFRELVRHTSHQTKTLDPRWHDPGANAHTGESHDFVIPSDVDVASLALTVTGVDKDDALEAMFKAISRRTATLGHAVIPLARFARAGRAAVTDEWYNLSPSVAHATNAHAGLSTQRGGDGGDGGAARVPPRGAAEVESNDVAKHGQVRLQVRVYFFISFVRQFSCCSLILLFALSVVCRSRSSRRASKAR